MAARLLFQDGPPFGTARGQPLSCSSETPRDQPAAPPGRAEDEMMVEDLPPVPYTPLPNTPRTRQPATPSKAPGAKRHKGPAGPQEPDRLQAPFGAKAPSQRALAFAQAVAKQRATTEDNWAVLQKATQCLDTLLAAFDPSEAPHKHKLATELTAALDATIMSFLKLGAAFPAFPAVPAAPTAPAAPALPAYATAQYRWPCRRPRFVPRRRQHRGSNARSRSCPPDRPPRKRGPQRLKNKTSGYSQGSPQTPYAYA